MEIFCWCFFLPVMGANSSARIFFVWPYVVLTVDAFGPADLCWLVIQHKKEWQEIGRHKDAPMIEIPSLLWPASATPLPGDALPDKEVALKKCTGTTGFCGNRSTSTTDSTCQVGLIWGLGEENNITSDDLGGAVEFDDNPLEPFHTFFPKYFPGCSDRHPGGCVKLRTLFLASKRHRISSV